MDTTFQSPKTSDTGGLEMKIDKSKKYIKDQTYALGK